ncbi:hypothetical protein ACHWQZ_G014520 [Mnemiopsis leidyi]
MDSSLESDELSGDLSASRHIEIPSSSRSSTRESKRQLRIVESTETIRSTLSPELCSSLSFGPLSSTHDQTCFLQEVFPFLYMQSEDEFNSEKPLNFNSLDLRLKQSISIPSSADQYKDNIIDMKKRAEVDGVLGPAVVRMDPGRSMGYFVYSQDKLDIEGKSNFSTCCANTALTKGKWMYEVLLLSRGIMQLGWTTPSSFANFTTQEGVGDTENSFAFDGKRIKKWNKGAIDYGEEWNVGDVIGCCIDLDIGEVSYYRNGVSLGVAFSNVKTGTNYAYFPAVSLSFEEHIRINFGDRPFNYKIEGFEPIQSYPAEELYCVDKYLVSINNILKIHLNSAKQTNLYFNQISMAHIFDKVGHLLGNPYIIHSLIVPFITEKCQLPEKRAKFFEALTTFLDDWELNHFVDELFHTVALISYCCIYSNQPTQKIQLLQLAIDMLADPKFSDIIVNSPLFGHRFMLFLHFKGPDGQLLSSVVPHAWWPGNEEHKDSFDNATKNIYGAIKQVEAMFAKMLDILISGRHLKKFLTYLNEFIQQILAVAVSLSNLRNIPIHQQAFMSNLFLAISRSLAENTTHMSASKVFIKPAYYTTKNIQSDFSDLPRVGGNHGHLKKEHKEYLSNLEQGEVDDMSHILNNTALLFHLGVYRRLLSADLFCREMTDHAAHLKAVQEKIKNCPADEKEVLEDLKQCEAVLEKDTITTSRMTAWIKTVILSENRMNDIIWMLRTLLRSVDVVEDAAFHFMPEFYMMAILNMYRALQECFPQKALIRHRQAPALFRELAHFFAKHICNPQIKSIDVRDHILQSSVIFVNYPQTLQALERLPEADCGSFMASIVANYGKTNYVHLSRMLIRFWKGHGFAYRDPPEYYNKRHEVLLPGVLAGTAMYMSVYEIEPNPSVKYQNLFSTFLSQGENGAKFINIVFNQLNSCLTEFMNSRKEIRKNHNTYTSLVERSCLMWYDLTIILVRFLEMISALSPQVMIANPEAMAYDPTPEINMERLVQLVIQIMSRNKQLVMTEDFFIIQRFSTIDILKLNCAVTGIVVHLYRNAPHLTEIFLKKLISERGFDMVVFQNFIRATVSVGQRRSRADFDYITSTEIVEVENLLSKIEELHRSMLVESRQSTIAEDDLCPICYDKPISAVFNPCGHRSCRACITMHLYNSKECFFCKTNIDNIRDIS